jgi:hypothetical protein
MLFAILFFLTAAPAYGSAVEMPLPFFRADLGILIDFDLRTGMKAPFFENLKSRATEEDEILALALAKL